MKAKVIFFSCNYFLNLFQKRRRKEVTSTGWYVAPVQGSPNYSLVNQGKTNNYPPVWSNLHTHGQHESTLHWCSAPIHHDCLAGFRLNFVQPHGKQCSIFKGIQCTDKFQLQPTPNLSLGPGSTFSSHICFLAAFKFR